MFKLKISNVKCQMTVCLRHLLFIIIIPSFVIFNLSFVILSSQVEAATLYKVRFAYYPQKIRVVFDLNGIFSYETDESKEKIVIRFKETEAGPDIQSYVELNDLVIRYFEIQKEEQDLKITIPLGEEVEYNIFYLNDPPRLVIDFGRDFLNVVSGGTIADGIEFLRAKKGSSSGIIEACALKIDLDKAEIEPALAQKTAPTFVESVIGFFSPWKGDGPKNGGGFALDKVSRIVDNNDAIAGVNGTYFAYSGRPLGALIVNQEMISFSLYDRTAFFLDMNNRPYIDNIDVASFFTVENGSRFKITGINQPRGSSEIIMYTRSWGPKTRANNQGVELVVENSALTKINIANSEIPEDGYVLSVRGPMIEPLLDAAKLGSIINSRIKILPFSTFPQNIRHLVAGGPRLLKKGKIYVSKHAEKFKRDIARGRAARTAIGITKDNEILLVTVNGPKRGKKNGQQNSIGATLEELAALMLSLGAVEAMNLDGGSSSTMVIDGKVVNSPTSNFQRRVSNAILIRPKP